MHLQHQANQRRDGAGANHGQFDGLLPREVHQCIHRLCQPKNGAHRRPFSGTQTASRNGGAQKIGEQPSRAGGDGGEESGQRAASHLLFCLLVPITSDLQQCH